jgi:hypothetical protein
MLKPEKLPFGRYPEYESVPAIKRSGPNFTTPKGRATPGNAFPPPWVPVLVQLAIDIATGGFQSYKTFTYWL